MTTPKELPPNGPRVSMPLGAEVEAGVNDKCHSLTEGVSSVDKHILANALVTAIFWGHEYSLDRSLVSVGSELIAALVSFRCKTRASRFSGW